MTTAQDTHPGDFLIPAILSPGEAQEHKARLHTLFEADPARRIEFTEAEGCTYASAVSLQLCLALVARQRAEGFRPDFGQEAQRLLAAQNL